MEANVLGSFRYRFLKPVYEKDLWDKSWEVLSPPDLQPGVQTILQHQVRLFDNLVAHASLCKDSEVCEYPNCFDGKLLYRHLFFCKDKTHTCQTCKSIRRIIDFHAQSCSQSNCIVPRCSEIKKEKLHKQQRLTSTEERLQRLRRLEPQRAAAAAAAALQLSLEASVKAMIHHSKPEY